MTGTSYDLANLSAAEQVQLVKDLRDSVVVKGSDAVPLTDAQRAELRRRADAQDADPSSAIPWEKIRAELVR